MKNISYIESCVAGVVVGFLVPFSVTDWRWWLTFVILYFPVTQLYAYIRDGIKILIKK